MTKIGEIYNTYENYKIEIVEYYTSKNCTIKFKDKNQAILCNIQLGQIKRGSIKNPYHPSICGLGYRGVGRYIVKDNKVTLKYYLLWSEVLKRCYNKKRLEKRPNYGGCTVVEEWHNFQNFAQWTENNYKPEYMEKWCLDKDILQKGNRIYSPETCCFVPNEINVLFTKNQINRGEFPIGVSYNKVYGKYSAILDKGYYDTELEAFQAYKTAKEQHIKEVADKWEDKISKKVHQAMYEYQVEITD